MALRRREITNKLVSVIKATNNCVKCRVLHNGTLSAPFVFGSGFKQGCTCAVFSSHWGHNSSLYRQTSHSVQVLWHKMEMDSFWQHFDYANDIFLLSHSVLDAANMLYLLENEAASFGLEINTGKTNSMSIVNSSTTRQTRPNAIVLNGHPVEEVNLFTYLGSEICKDGGSNADVDCRVRKAKEAFGILSSIWRNSSFPNKLKVRIWRICS